ncbi:MAG: hypothetical protein GX879_00630, partial [Bacteroidales bacterium]|nr:hypothetical protein [Bacteroidales bacterium]
DPDALSVIAQKADGAMRDALSIFDQIVSFSGNTITYESTIENLNVLDYDYYFRITESLLQGDYANALIIYNEIVEDGFDGGIFINGLASHFRDILMCKNPGTLKLLEVGVNIQKKYHEFSEKAPIKFLYKAIEIAGDADYKYKTVKNKRLLVEISLMKISQEGNPSILSSETLVTSESKQEYTKTVKTNISSASTEQKTEAKTPVQTKTVEEVKPISPEPQASENLVSEPKEKIETKQEQDTPPSSIPNLSGLSIRNIGKQNVTNSANKDTEEALIDDSVGQDEFSSTMLSSAWSEFSETLQDKPRLQQLFKNTEPTLSENYIINLELANNSLLEILHTIKGDLLQFLRTKLNNRLIDVNLSVAETPQNTEGLLYTDDEKLRYMREKQPELNNLMQQLGLDL